MPTIVGKINEPVKMEVEQPGDWKQINTGAPMVNLRVELDGTSASFTPSVNGTYEFHCSSSAEPFVVTVGSTPTPEPTVCPPNMHWDAALGKCVPDVVTPPTTGLLYSSNIQGKWANGVARFVTDKEGNIGSNGFGFTVNASGGGGFRIDGKGQGTLEPTSSGHRRIYPAVCNYNAGIRGKFAFLTGKERNASIKGRNRHQYGDVDSNAPASKRQGGLGFHFSLEDQKAGFQYEIVHGTNGGDFDVSLPKNLEVGKFYGFDVSYVDASPTTVAIASKLDYGDGQGMRTIFSKTVMVPSVFFDKASFMEWSQFWLRLNDEGKLAWKDIEVYAL